MILSYLIHPFDSDGKRAKSEAKVTTDHSASSYGQPVIVLPDGEALDLVSWVGCSYKIERATKKEREVMAKLGLA